MNEQSAELKEFTHGKTPCVVMARLSEYVMVLDAKELASCNGAVADFERSLLAYLSPQS